MPEQHDQHETQPLPSQAGAPSAAGGSAGGGGLLTRLVRSKAVLATLVAVALVAVAGTTYGYSSMSEEVTLSVDGERQEISTTADTVGGVLEAEGVEVDQRDVVAPDLDEPIEEGSLINVRFARPVELTVDGDKTTTHWVTSTDVQSALGEIGRTFEQARLSTSRGGSIDRGGIELSVVTPKKIKVQVGGKKPKTRSVPALTVKDALDRMGVKVDKRDRVKPKRRAELEDGDKIVVTKIRWDRTKVTGQEVDFETVERETDEMLEGETETVREGRPGARNVSYRVIYRNGEVKRRVELRSNLTREPVDEIVRVGTREPAPEPEPEPEPEPAAPNFASGNTVWDRLAECESGGNWSINTGNGYYGGLQFNLQTWRGFGGVGYPHEQSREYQIMIAERVRDARGGYGAWPACSASLGLPQ